MFDAIDALDERWARRPLRRPVPVHPEDRSRPNQNAHGGAQQVAVVYAAAGRSTWRDTRFGPVR